MGLGIVAVPVKASGSHNRAKESSSSGFNSGAERSNRKSTAALDSAEANLTNYKAKVSIAVLYRGRLIFYPRAITFNSSCIKSAAMVT